MSSALFAATFVSLRSFVSLVRPRRDICLAISVQETSHHF
jgi:hypothetical protein